MLTNRIDAEHYDPRLLASERAVSIAFGDQMSTLEVMRASESTITYGIVQPGEFQKPGEGVRLIRCTDVFDMTIAVDQVLWVSSLLESSYTRSRVEPGDVLIGIAGSLGAIGLVPPGIQPANLNQSVARLRPRSSTAGAWIAAYLDSKYGQDILVRRAVGGVQRHLNLADLPDVPVPDLNPIVMAYVGEKVRQAEALRERGRAGRRRAIGEIGQIVPVDTDAPVGRSQRVPAAALGSRLDCNFYSPRSMQVERAMRSAVPTIALKDVVLPERSITNGVRGPELVNSLYRLIRLQDCIDWTIDYSKSLTISRDQFEDNRRCRLRGGDVVVAIGGYIGNAALVKDDIPAVIGQHSAVIAVNPNGPILASYLTAYLNSSIAAAHFSRYISGTVQAGINLEDLREIEVPLPDKSLQRKIGESADLFIRASSLARALVAAARMLVEALIERRVTETQLIAASVEPAADRALLARITHGGLDVEGEPLFPDLDALFTLLDPEDR